MREYSQQVSGQQSAQRRRILERREGSSLFLLILFFTVDCLLLTAYPSADELKDVKGPVGLPETPWLLIVAAVLGAAVFALGVWFWLHKLASRAKKVQLKTPWDAAYERLNELKRRDLFGQGKAQEHFIELSAIVRTYIEERFSIRAPEMTTEEFLDSVKNASNVEGKQKEILKSFMGLCDMVKFAKYPPSAQEAAQSFELAKRFVDETKVTDSISEVTQVKEL